MQSLLQNIWADNLVSYFVFRSVHSRVSCQSLCILHLEMSTEDISLMSHFKIDYKIINAFLWSPILTSFQSIKKWAIVPHRKNSNLIHTYTQCHPEEKRRLKVTCTVCIIALLNFLTVRLEWGLRATLLPSIWAALSQDECSHSRTSSRALQ